MNDNVAFQENELRAKAAAGGDKKAAAAPGKAEAKKPEGK